MQATDTTARLTGIWGSSASNIYVSVNSNFILHSDGGGSWTHEPTATGEVFRDIWGSSADAIYALAGGGVDVSDGGGDWSAHETINDYAFTTAIWGASADQLFVATNYSDSPTVFRSSGDGNWSGDEGSPAVSLRDISGSSASHLYVAGGDSVYFSRGDGSFAPELVVPGGVANAVWAASEDTVYACSADGYVYRSNGAGEWSEGDVIDADKVGTLNCHAIWGSAGDDVYLAATGAIYHGTR
jgi:hypothetical protein